MKQPDMLELKFGKKPDGSQGASSCCPGPGAGAVESPKNAARCPDKKQAVPAWVSGQVMSPTGPVARITTELSRSDHWEHVKCRISAFRNSYTVNPGLYAVGNPGKTSDVLVSANYKFSFDLLRRELKGLDAWMLVLDTKGINVWCAAG